MNNNLENYVRVYKKTFTEDFCNDLIENLKVCNFTKAPFKDYFGNSHIRDTDCFQYMLQHDIHKKLNWMYFEKIMLELFSTLDDYHKTLNFSWYCGWNGFTPIKFNKYISSTEMINHCDHIHEVFDGERKGIPTLTIIGLLNNNFVGGEFVLFEDKIYSLEQGDVIIFPSVFLYPHKVLPIQTGERYSFVSWVF